MPVSKENIIDALRTVDDPDLKKDLVTLNMIRDVTVKEKEISFTVVLTTPACPLKEKIKKDCVDAVRIVAGPEYSIKIEMTSDVSSLNQNQELKGVRNVIAVASGKGGVGKSTVAANLAVALAMSGAKVGLVDADIYGPSVPLFFGLQGERPNVINKDGKDMLVPFIKYGVKLNSIGFLVEPGQAVVWRGPMASKALQQLIFDTNWEDLDYLIIDMPPGTGDIHLTLVQRLPVTGVLIVTTPQEVALADARKGAEMFRMPQVNVPILGIVENMSYFSTPENPEKKYFLFGKGGGETLAQELNVPLLAQLPIVETVREGGDSGSPIAIKSESESGKAFMLLAGNTARMIAMRNGQAPPTQKVEILYR